MPISTLDATATTLVANKNCFVLIDIEGAEYGCLKGSKNLLSSNMKNLFMVEIHVGEHQPTRIDINPKLFQTFKLFSNHGYSAYTADRKLRKIELSEVKEIVESRVNTLSTHNFIFIKNNFSLSDFGL